MKLPRSSHTASHLHFWHHHTPSEINLFLTRKRTGRIPVLSNKILYFSKTVSKMILAATYNITHRLQKTATLTLITPNLFKARRTRSNTRSRIRNPNRKWSTNRLSPSYPTVLFFLKRSKDKLLTMNPVSTAAPATISFSLQCPAGTKQSTQKPATASTKQKTKQLTQTRSFLMS